jgi:hypothetical protein
MRWLNPHRRIQDRLSAYLDAELPVDEARMVDAHVRSCGSCAQELAELRLAAAALADLPEVDVPRSFALTPADARPAGRVPAGLSSLNSGLRITGGVLAAALAVILVLDAGGIVGEDGGDSGADNAATAEMAANALGPLEREDENADGDAGITEEMGRGDLDSAQGYEATASPAPPVNPGSAGVADGGGPASGAGAPADQPAGTAAPTAAPVPLGIETPVPAPARDTGDDADVSEPTSTDAAGMPFDSLRVPTLSPEGGFAAEVPSGQVERDEETLNAIDANEDSGDGPSALTVIEVILAALLGASVIGVGAATYAGRRGR